MPHAPPVGDIKGLQIRSYYEYILDARTPQVNVLLSSTNVLRISSFAEEQWLYPKDKDFS
jgi:hypothetical protein